MPVNLITIKASFASRLYKVFGRYFMRNAHESEFYVFPYMYFITIYICPFFFNGMLIHLPSVTTSGVKTFSRDNLINFGPIPAVAQLTLDWSVVVPWGSPGPLCFRPSNWRRAFSPRRCFHPPCPCRPDRLRFGLRPRTELPLLCPDSLWVELRLPRALVLPCPGSSLQSPFPINYRVCLKSGLKHNKRVRENRFRGTAYHLF